eukprot:gene22763-29931_t
MPSWNVRCRGPAGQSTLQCDSDMPVFEFQALLQEKTGIAADRQEVLAGFPPKPIEWPSDCAAASLSTLPLVNGDTVVVRERESAAPVVTPPAAEAALPVDEDDDLARAIAASLEVSLPQPSKAGAPQVAELSQLQTPSAIQSNAVATSSTGPGQPAPTSVQLADGSCVVRRVIDSDNSCLFNAMGYVMEHSRLKSKELRGVIANVVSSNPDMYNEAFLGKENAEYCKWIQEPSKWGGAIELSILSAHYQREIAAYDISTQRCDLYGCVAGYSEQVMLLYDGLHYDAIAISAFDGAPEELDITIFEPKLPTSICAKEGAAKLACQIGLKGEKEAVEHAKSTGHSNFSEY